MANTLPRIAAASLTSRTVRRLNVPPHWMIYFMVSDCDASAAKAKELGGAIHMAPSTMEGVGRMAVMADGQGAVFALFQPA